MNIFIYRNGVTDGPYDLEDLRRMGIGPDDLVWFRGQSQWMRACEAPHTSRLFAGRAAQTARTGQPDAGDSEAGQSGGAADVQSPEGDTGSVDAGAGMQDAAADGTEQKVPAGVFGKPVTFLICNLLTSFCCCCCNLLSIPSLIFSIRAMMASRPEDSAKRAYCMRQARLWTIISLIAGPALVLIIGLIVFLTGSYDGISEGIADSIPSGMFRYVP